MRRNNDGLFQDDRECGGNGIVIGGAALEIDYVAELPSTHHSVQIVQGHRVGQARAQIGNGRTLQQQAAYIPRHEDGAAFAQANRAFATIRPAARIPLDRNSQLLGLLFQKRTRARGASFIHGEVHDDTIADANELGILPADLEDRVHQRHPQLMAHMHRAGFVRSDLVIYGVGSGEFADQFPPRPRRARHREC